MTTTGSTLAQRQELFATARAEALFVSHWQPSAGVVEARAAVRRAVAAYGVRGCAALVAYHFGEYPEEAAARMRCAAKAVAALYPPRKAADR